MPRSNPGALGSVSPELLQALPTAAASPRQRRHPPPLPIIPRSQPSSPSKRATAAAPRFFSLYRVLSVLAIACVVTGASFAFLLLRQLDIGNAELTGWQASWLRSEPAGRAIGWSLKKPWAATEKRVEDAVDGAEDTGIDRALQRRWQSVEATLRQPRVALVCAELEVQPGGAYLLTLGQALLSLRYHLQVIVARKGALAADWERVGIKVVELSPVKAGKAGHAVDWLLFDAVLVYGLHSAPFIRLLKQEPFNEVGVVWVVAEEALALKVPEYLSAVDSIMQLLGSWMDLLERAQRVVFTSHHLKRLHRLFEAPHFRVASGSPEEAWRALQFAATHTRSQERAARGLPATEFVIVALGGPLLGPSGPWQDHVVALRALSVLVQERARLRGLRAAGGWAFRMVLLGQWEGSTEYAAQLRAYAEALGVQKQLQLAPLQGSVEGWLLAADAVAYITSHPQPDVPPLLVRALALERPVVAVEQAVLRAELAPLQAALLLRAGDPKALAQALSQVPCLRAHAPAFSSTCLVGSAPHADVEASGFLQLSLGPQAGEVAKRLGQAGGQAARQVGAARVLRQLAHTLEAVLNLPALMALPSEPASLALAEWWWPSKALLSAPPTSNRSKVPSLDAVAAEERRWRAGAVLQGRQEASRNVSRLGRSGLLQLRSFILGEPRPQQDPGEQQGGLPQEEEEALEEALLEDRTEQAVDDWEEVSKAVKRAGKGSAAVEEGALERSGLPLTLYQLCPGPGAWPFLHKARPLYRTLALSRGAVRPGSDDVEAPARLGVLKEGYYARILGAWGGILALATKLEELHRSPWIGFQTWRAHSLGMALSPAAEGVLEGIAREEGKSGVVVFWGSRMQQPLHTAPFWDHCDAQTAAHCREAFTAATRLMYSLPNTWQGLPPMPAGHHPWPVLECWAMPTQSFLELVVYARIFIDALDHLYYQETHDNGRCPFARGRAPGEGCYEGVLERVVSVWVMHTGRRLLYLDPLSGQLEGHPRHPRSRWKPFFNATTLAAMQEERADEADAEPGARRWLWPQLGELWCAAQEERARIQREAEKAAKQAKLKERRLRPRQERLGGKKPQARKVAGKSQVSEKKRRRALKSAAEADIGRHDKSATHAG